mgnify:CR=1 FL=1
MLDFNVWNIVWSVVNILILYILLRIFLFKPIRKIMNERTQMVQNDLDSAKKSKEEAEELKKQYDEDLSNAKEEAQKIIAEAQGIAESEKAVMLKKSQEEADRLIVDANKNIENERKKIIQQTQSKIADLAIEAASKIIGENVDDDKNRRLVDKFLSEEESDI